MTRARVVWATSPAFAAQAEAGLKQALRQTRDTTKTTKDVRDMRLLMAKELPASGFWDMKRSPGGLIDIEFAAQYLQIVHAASGGPLHPNTGAALLALEGAGLVSEQTTRQLRDAWRLQQDLSQLLRVALDRSADPASEPTAYRALLARAGEAADFAALRAKVRDQRALARAAYEAVLSAAPASATD